MRRAPRATWFRPSTRAELALKTVALSPAAPQAAPGCIDTGLWEVGPSPGAASRPGPGVPEPAPARPVPGCPVKGIRSDALLLSVVPVRCSASTRSTERALNELALAAVCTNWKAALLRNRFWDEAKSRARQHQEVSMSSANEILRDLAIAGACRSSTAAGRNASLLALPSSCGSGSSGGSSDIGR